MILPGGCRSQKADQPIRVLLVDDHDHVLWGLKKLVDGEWPRMKAAGTVKSLDELSPALHFAKPDVVVLDLCVGERGTLGLLPGIRQSGAAALVLTSSRSELVHRRALEGGARSVVLKEEPAEVLLREIQRVHEWRTAPPASREQDCHLAVKARIAGFLLTTKRR